MREILFRGKRIDSGEWAEGYYVPMGEYHYILTGRLELVPYLDFEHFLVNSETVGRFTGLTDKNGVKIFEGDIVNVKARSCSFTGCVIYWSEEARYACKTKSGTRYAICNKFEFEVLGNIHDNPELLEVSSDE